MLNFANIDPIRMLYYAAATNGLLAPPLLIIILFIANNKRILHDRTNGIVSNVLGITITVIMAVVSLFTIESFFR